MLLLVHCNFYHNVERFTRKCKQFLCQANEIFIRPCLLSFALFCCFQSCSKLFRCFILNIAPRKTCSISRKNRTVLWICTCILVILRSTETQMTLYLPSGSLSVCPFRTKFDLSRWSTNNSPVESPSGQNTIKVVRKSIQFVCRWVGKPSVDLVDFNCSAVVDQDLNKRKMSHLQFRKFAWWYD